MDEISRREFIKLTGMAATTGLTIALGGFTGGCSRATDMNDHDSNWPAWIRIQPDNEIVLQIPRIELGQGAPTALAMLVAEELDADWSRIRIQAAPLDDVYGKQSTDSSDSVRLHWEQLRKLGAITRQQLIHAAAKQWGVPAHSCATSAGKVIHNETNRQASYGELIATASELPLPDSYTLKNAQDFRFIGKSPPRLDIPAMTDGSLKYTADIELPGLLTAAVKHSPALGGKVARINDKPVLAIDGVKAVVDLGNAVAVVADEYWSAAKGLQQLEVEWTEPETPALDNTAMWQLLATRSNQPGHAVYTRGNPDITFEQTPDAYSQTYTLPYHAHACMETPTCIADVRPDACEIWAPTQDPWATYRVALEHGLSSFQRLKERIWLKLTRRAGERIKLHVIPAGGGFGRKLYQDFVKQAVLVSRAVKAPVKLIWSREEDIRNDLYQPASYHSLHAVMDNDNKLSAWRHRIAGSGILSYETTFPYQCEHVSIEVSGNNIGVPTGSWRSVSDTPNAYARESFINYLCRKIGRDPVDYRLSLLLSERMRQTLQLAANAANWFEHAPENILKGVAIHEARGSYVAHIVEVMQQPDNTPKITRIVCAIDCGQVVNPDGVRAQMEGGIVFGLSTILSKGIQVQNGRITQSNFHDYKLLRITQMPAVEVHLVNSTAKPGGVGETGVPPLAPALHGALLGHYELRDLQH